MPRLRKHDGACHTGAGKQESGVAAGTIPIKTAQGQAELSTRQRRVSQRHRTVLFLVDGRRSATEVRSMALRAGVPESCFDELLELGLLTLPEPAVLQEDVLHVELPLQASDSVMPDSLLPPSRTLYPESVLTDSTLGGWPDAWPSSGANAQDAAADSNFEEARRILLQAVRAEAPLTGSLTLLKLRRAGSRAELRRLLDEVEGRISKPHRSLAATHTMRRVRQLLDGRLDSSLAPPETTS
jgi:hypothetical protein